MADNWRILELMGLRGELNFQTKTRRLEILDIQTGEMTTHALDDVNIIFVGVGVALTSSVLYHCAQHDVVVICCDWKRQPVCAMYPWVGCHSRIGARHRAQAYQSIPRGKNAWKRIVKAKIRGQANNLNSLGCGVGEQLLQLSATVKSGDPSNVEGHAASIYLSHLFGDESFRRLPGEKAGGRNDLLDYGYTLLRGFSVRAILSAGLNPTLGIFHHGRSNEFALADDLIEPYRPALDFAVAKLPEDSVVDDRDVRQYLLMASIGTFNEAGLSIGASMIDLAQQYGRYVEGEVESLQVEHWDPVKVGTNHDR